MNTPKWIVIIVLVLALSVPAMPASAAPSASIRLTSPTPNPGLVGGDVSFELAVDVAEINPGVAGAEIFLRYEGPVSPPASPLGVAVALPDFFGVSDISIKEILPAEDPRCNGSPCIHLVVAGPPQATHSGAAARFFFRCTAEGTARFSVLTSTLVNADGFQVLHTPASPVSVPCVFRATVNGKALRQGTPANPNPGGGTPACSEMWSTNGATRFGPVFTDGSGNFTLPNLTSGTHILHAEYSGYLASEKSITVGPGGLLIVEAGTTTLRGGDINGDNAINILDIGTIISKFGKSGLAVKSSSPNCAGPDEPADINDDNLVNISDLAIAAGNWGLTEPRPWP